MCIWELLIYKRIWINSSPPGQNGRLYTDNIFRCFFVHRKFCIWLQISLKFVPKGPMNNISGADQATSHYLNQRRPSSLTHICGTRGRWVKNDGVIQLTTHVSKAYKSIYLKHISVKVTRYSPSYSLKRHWWHPLQFCLVCLSYVINIVNKWWLNLNMFNFRFKLN